MNTPLNVEAADSASVEEEPLVAQARANDSRALSAIYELYFDKIYRYVAVKLDDRDEAEDVTQDVFLRVLGSIKSYHQTGVPFSAWLYRIARNLVIDHLRHNSRYKHDALDNFELLSTCTRDNPQALAEVNFDMEQYVRALKRLTPPQREVIILRFASELPMSKVAKIMGKRECTVKSLQHRAIVNLKKNCHMGDGKEI